ncbi:LacI family DNA-binding transcriptional regulator [Amphibiibacter pelophylacis]|uniref:LacI family DNA-binding transcriptional regulator n=1 Tax=Amphibiibacter pelophylacis TaxID=1799477 RepID=A0ACC6P0L2_9BURK
MTDVAKAAGVSQSTVSMVLNNNTSARLSATTRQRVLREARKLGYALPQRQGARAEPETAARRNVIAYLVDEISTSPHPVVNIDGAVAAARDRDLIVQVSVTHGDAALEKELIAAHLAHPQLLGFVYSAIFTRAVQVPEALLAWPTVLLNCHDDRHRLPTVVPGELAGGHTATEHLIRQGHQRIAFINGEPWMEAAKDRLKGYRRALATADLPFDPELVRDGDWMSGTGYEATLSLMALPRPPSAIFCANDLMAIGALEAVRSLGLAVPQDVSVMGYDDQEISRHTHPPLTTVVLPNFEMGHCAVETLLEEVQARASQGEGARPLLKIECPLVQRQSVAGV